VINELPTLRAESVLLRPFSPSDTPIVREASKDTLIPKITTVPVVDSEMEALAYIGRQHDRFKSGLGFSFAICTGDGTQAVGQIGVWVADLAKGRATVGYWIGRSARGHGHAGRALDLVSGWAFEVLPIHRLNAYVEPWNVASIRTAESAGFRSEGLLRSWELVDGEPKDMLSMSRLRSPI
jgi:[ribosomal protein S5]-alanine N-acetyltransferase